MLNHRRRFIAVIAGVLLSAAATVLIVAESRSTAQPLVPAAIAVISPTQPPPPITVTPSLLRTTLIRLRLDPGALAAANVAPASVATVVDDASDHLAIAAPMLDAADQNIGQLSQTVRSLAASVQSGTAAPDDAAELASVQAELAAAIAGRQAALDDLHESAAASLAPDQRERLEALRTNDNWEIPAPYCVTTRSEAQFVSLREALAHERWAEAHDAELESGVQSLLAQIRAEAPVALALSNTATNLTGITSAWNTAID